MSNTKYPLMKFHFKVNWDNNVELSFSEVSGMTFERESAEYSWGDNSQFSSVKVPGRIKNSNITMKRGTFRGDSSLYDWWSKITINTTERRDITISLLDEKHQPVITWKVQQAFPIKMQSTDLKADANDVAVETLELVHEGLTIEYSK